MRQSGWAGWGSRAIRVFIIVVLLGCGNDTTSSPPENGQFIDAAVSGLGFETPTQRGTTDSNGTFQYHEGEEISFFLGDIYLGETAAKPVISPLDLINGSPTPEHQAVTNICRLLQTLDDDGNPENGIEIRPDVREAASGIFLDFHLSSEEFADNLEVNDTLSTLLAHRNGERPNLVEAKAAQRHLRMSLGMAPPAEDEGETPSKEAEGSAGEDDDETDAAEEDEESAETGGPGDAAVDGPAEVDDAPASPDSEGSDSDENEGETEGEGNETEASDEAGGGPADDSSDDWGKDAGDGDADPQGESDADRETGDESSGGWTVDPADDPSETPENEMGGDDEGSDEATDESSGTETEENEEDSDDATNDLPENDTDGNDDDSDDTTDETPKNETDRNDDDSDGTAENPVEEICGDGVDQDGDGVDGLCPEGEETRLKVSILTPEPGDDSVSEIWLDIEKVLACGGPGGCQMVGGESRVNLLNAEAVATTLLDSFLIEETVGHLRFVLGGESAVVVDGISHPLSVPGGETAGLKLMWGKKLEAFELNELLLDFDPLANLSHNPGQGYVLRSVMRAQADVTAPFAAGTAVVEPAWGGAYEKAGKFKMEVPAGAVDSAGILWETESEVEDGAITPTFTLGPDGSQFAAPIKVTLHYDPVDIPEGFTEDDLVIFHDGVIAETRINKESTTVEANISHFSGVQAILLHRADFVDPNPVFPGQRFNIQFTLYNDSSILAQDYFLFEYESNYSDGTTQFPRFTILPGAEGTGQILDFPAPMGLGDYRVYVRIKDAEGDILPLETASGRTFTPMYFDFEVVEGNPVEPLEKPDLNSPSDDSEGVSLTPDFSWHSVDQAEYYRVCLDSSRSTLSGTDASCSDCLVKKGSLTETSLSLLSLSEKLEPGETYYWKVKAWSENNGDSTSDIWSFTTESDDGGEGGDGGGNEDEDEDDPVDPECGPQAILVYQGETITPSGAAAGDLVTVNYTLKNESGQDADGYTLLSLSPAPEANYPPFSIPAGATGFATAENIPYPAPGQKTYFDLVDGCGNPLPALSGGRMYIGEEIVDPCAGATPPTINFMDVWQGGCGNVMASADVSGNEGEPTFGLNDVTQRMTSLASGAFGGAVAGAMQAGMNALQVVAPGTCDTSTTFGPVDTPGVCTDRLGNFSFKGPCGGTSGAPGDPVNTAIGNFVFNESDGRVAGLGGTTIQLDRTYNSQAAVWTPASIKRYNQNEDGDIEEEIIAGPPQYFGKGWTSVLGQYLLVIDQAPLFQGVQVLYADGHTALFEDRGDGTFLSDSPLNFDLVQKEGEEYVLYDNGCACSLDTRRFDADGKLLAISDRNGNEIRLNYNGDQLASVENASGRRIEFVSDEEGRITQATLPEGIFLTYEYTDDLLTAFVDGRGDRTEYQYDEDGQMTDILTPKGHPHARNAYNEDFRVTEQIVGETETYLFEYSDEGTSVADAYGNITFHHYDDEKRLVQIDHPDGTTELYEYDDDFNRTYYQDQAGAEWHWTYDENGNRLTADGPLGWHREWEYNERNQVVRMTEKVDANKTRTTTFEYDANGNLIRFCNPLGDCGSVAYDGLGLPLEMIDFAGNATRHAYDGEGDLTAVIDAESATVRFDHDGLGRVTEMQKPMGAEYRYTYDPDSHLVAVDGPLGFRLEFAFDPNDNLARKVDPNGGAIQYAYNESDRLANVQNQLGFDVATYAYGLMNELTGFTDAEGRSWSYAYDNLLRVVQVDGPLNTRFSYDYNPVGKITDFTDANGIVTHTEYDPLYRPVSVIRNYRPGMAPNADTNVTTTYEYDLVGDVLAATDPDGYVTQFVYDLMGRRTDKKDAEGYAWAYAYDPMGNLTEVLNPRGFAAEFDYTPTYRTARGVNPEGHAVANAYDADGRLVEQTDAKGVVTRFEYDELDRLVRKIRNYKPAMAADSETNVTTEYAYDLAGNLRYLTNPRDYEAEIVYDAAHRRTELYDFEDGQTRFAYDRVNNLLTVTDAEGNTTTYQYDDLNRMVATTNAENETEAYQYDPMGNRTHLVQADGTVTQYGYDAIYRLNAVTQNHRPTMSPSNDTNVLTQYAYNARGLLTQIENANGAVTAFDYNAVGRMVQETDPLGNVWGYEYDGVGNRVRRVDAKGDPTEYAYYPDDMLEEIRYADGTGVEYAYDPNNNRVSMRDWLGGTEWDYDPLNRITAQDDPFGRGLAYAYDAASNRTGMTYPDGNRVSYTFSPNNWMDSVTIPGDLTMRYTRDRVGNILHTENPNSTITEMEYDNVYRVLRLANRQTAGGAKVNSAFDYTYNEVGHITEAVKEYGWRNPPVVTETYTYDGLHRLVGTVMDPIKNNGLKEFLSYRYDPVGNRLESASLHGQNTSSPTDGYTKTYAYNAANQLLTVETDSVKKNPNVNMVTTYAYDANGNRINKESVDLNDKNALVEGFDYAFDPENRMVQALAYQLGGKQQKVRTDRHVTDLEYDGGGRRLAKSYDPKSNAAKGVDKRVEYVFSGLDPVAEYEMLNGQRDNYYRGAMGRIVTRQHFNSGATGQRYWYHYNHKHDVVGLTKHNGNSTHNYRYDPYGDVLPDNGNFTDPHNHYTLTGKEFDENTGLVYFGARHYDPEVGVWVSQDSYRGRLVFPESIHRYVYVYNNSINFFDLFGFTAQCPSSPPSSNDTEWIEYKGNPFVFHCGYDGYLENRYPLPEDPIAECFYDEHNTLVDDNHEYSGCKGTPDQYPAEDWWNHTVNDDGGIRKSGGEAFVESSGYNIEKAGEAIVDGAVAVGQAVVDAGEAVVDSGKAALEGVAQTFNDIENALKSGRCRLTMTGFQCR